MNLLCDGIFGVQANWVPFFFSLQISQGALVEDELVCFQAFSEAFRNEGYITVKTLPCTSDCPKHPAGLLQ